MHDTLIVKIKLLLGMFGKRTFLREQLKKKNQIYYNTHTALCTYF